MRWCPVDSPLPFERLAKGGVVRVSHKEGEETLTLTFEDRPASAPQEPELVE